MEENVTLIVTLQLSKRVKDRIHARDSVLTAWQDRKGSNYAWIVGESLLSDLPAFQVVPHL